MGLDTRSGIPRQGMMSRRMGIIIAVLGMFLFVSPAYAEGEVNDFLSIANTAAGRDAAGIMLSGMEAGLRTANAYVVTVRKQQPLYCQPANLTLAGEQLLDMLQRGVAEDATLGTTELSVAVFVLFRKTFPCPNPN